MQVCCLLLHVAHLITKKITCAQLGGLVLTGQCAHLYTCTCSPEQNSLVQFFTCARHLISVHCLVVWCLLASVRGSHPRRFTEPWVSCHQEKIPGVWNIWDIWTLYLDFLFGLFKCLDCDCLPMPPQLPPGENPRSLDFKIFEIFGPLTEAY